VIKIREINPVIIVIPMVVAALIVLVGYVIRESHLQESHRLHCREVCDPQRSKILEDRCHCKFEDGWKDRSGKR